MNAHQRRIFNRMLARVQSGQEIKSKRGTRKHELLRRVELHLFKSSAFQVMLKVAKTIREVPVASGRAEIIGGFGLMPTPVPMNVAKKPSLWQRFASTVDSLIGRLASLRSDKALATAGAE